MRVVRTRATVTHPILKDEAPAEVAELSVKYRTGPIVRYMLLRFSLSILEGILGNLRSQAVVSPEGFLCHGVSQVICIHREGDHPTYLAVVAVAQ